MKLVKCDNGHFYDEERYDSCPHCNAPSARNDDLTMPVMRTPANDAVTVAMDATEVSPTSAIGTGAIGTGATGSDSSKSSLKDAVQAASSGAAQSAAMDNDKTVGFFSSTIGKEPVVGWLVCVAGEHFGEDFKLKSGRNFIGRGAGMDVSIAKDNTVSRERHAIVVYEPKGNVFIVQPGDSKELCYLNDEVVLSPTQLKINDRLLVGKTELMFIPCCSGAFNWDMVAPKEEN